MLLGKVYSVGKGVACTGGWTPRNVLYPGCCLILGGEAQHHPIKRPCPLHHLVDQSILLVEYIGLQPFQGVAQWMLQGVNDIVSQTASVDINFLFKITTIIV